MNKELELKLVEKYPIILRDYGGDYTKTCMHFGMECGDGWYDLIDDLLGKLDYISKHSGVQIVADQIKEKFGTLRFYYSTIIKTDFNVEPIVDKIIDDLVSHAESKSKYTCEITGERGALCSRNGWLRTLSKDEAGKDGYAPIDERVAKYWDQIDNEIHKDNTEQKS
jgi:hypothetical protein